MSKGRFIFLAIGAFVIACMIVKTLDPPWGGSPQPNSQLAAATLWWVGFVLVGMALMPRGGL